MSFAIFWSWKIGDVDWSTEEMLFPILSGGWFLAVILGQDEISNMEFYEHTLLGCGLLFYSLGEVCAKMGYLSEVYVRYIKLIGVILVCLVLLMAFIGTPVLMWIKNRKYNEDRDNEH